MKGVKRNYVLVGLMIFGMGFVYFLASSVVPRMLVTLTKAAPATVISLKDSYVLGEKLLAKADGVDKCIVNVFIMDATGKGIGGKEVTLEGIEGIVEKVRLTNKDGKASFKIISKIEGTFAVDASVGGTPMDKSVKVTFRN